MLAEGEVKKEIAKKETIFFFEGKGMTKPKERKNGLTHLRAVCHSG